MSADQVIEISDIGLIHTIMKNLGIEKSDYSITSRAAGFITKKYLETEDPALLEDPEHAVKNADLVIFGGHRCLIMRIRCFIKRQQLHWKLRKNIINQFFFQALA